MASTGEFRLGRGLLHAGIAFVLVVVLTGTLAVVLDVADPKRFGEGVGRFSLFVILATFGVSYLSQTGKTLAARLVGGALAAVVLGTLGLITYLAATRTDDRPPPAPTADLQRADGTLRHPTLGFSIPDPGDNLDARPKLAKQFLPAREDTRGWVYGDENAGEVVVVILATDAAGDERTFKGFFEGMIAGQISSITQTGMVPEEQERSITWSDRRGHAYVVADPLHMRFDAFGLAGGEGLFVMSTATVSERFADLADGVERP
ncbi:MAG: hypothetical protein K0V04_24105 [Deltaproteobacteria bacterium]|nr:hypothetical protein [Deltaproteobacteria bacterium]